MSRMTKRRQFFIYLFTPFIVVLTAIFMPFVLAWKMSKSAWELADAAIEKYTR